MFLARLVLPAAFLMIGVSALAQSPRFELGVRGGPTLSWLRGNRMVADTDALLGAAFAADLQYDLNATVGLRIGVGHQRKGTSEEVIFTDRTGNTVNGGYLRTKLDYLTMPLQLRASFGKGTRFSIGAGPYVGYLLREGRWYKGKEVSGGFDITDQIKRWDLGVSAGAGAGWSLGGRITLNADVRFDKGLVNISGLPMFGETLRTSAVCLLIGCGYRFGSV